MVYLEATSLGNIRGECFFLGGDEEDGKDVMMFIRLFIHCDEILCPQTSVNLFKIHTVKL